MVEKRFTDKVIVITGASRGIGLACAKRFEMEGAKVCTIQRSKSKLFDSYEFNLKHEQECLESISAIYKKYGCIDVLVNNAGMMEEALIQDTSIDSWNNTLSLNLTAPFLMSKFAMPHLIRSKGCIVNIGSIEGIGAIQSMLLIVQVRLVFMALQEQLQLIMELMVFAVMQLHLDGLILNSMKILLMQCQIQVLLKII